VIVENKRRRIKMVTKIISTIRHPEFTPISRLIMGDMMLEYVANLYPEAEVYRLTWEAHTMGWVETIGMSWRIPNLAGMEAAICSNLATVPWWLTATQLEPHLRVLKSEANWKEVERILLKAQLPVSEVELQQRHQTVMQLMFEALESGGPLSLAIYDYYLQIAKLLLGPSYKPNYPLQPYMCAAGDLTVARITELGFDWIKAVMTKLRPNGDKNLLLGSNPEDIDELLYIGWSPEGVFKQVRCSAINGKTKGKPKVVHFDSILELVSTGKFIPISLFSMLLFLTDESVLHHGAEYGNRKELEAVGLATKSSCITYPMDSWPVCTLSKTEREITPNLVDLYLLFGAENPFVAELVRESWDQRAPVKLAWQQISN
jgi:hypothetical protein